ncbi:NADH-cytochrome b5 reductase [Entomophthora muscae]|uniref:NADH-cytochrome b5 reductase n=1 Tax=Entomophthora muscae TaxID=34485 RepID=A0ACC2SQV2_9FUNG|nr:NADH-cytochrome b5 reductase [Entomophthora muscae]
MSSVLKAAFGISRRFQATSSVSSIRNLSSGSRTKSHFNKLLFIGTPVGVAAGFYLFSQDSPAPVAIEDQPKRVFPINAQEFTSFKIKEITELTHDTKLYRFEIPDSQALLLPVTSCIVTRTPPKEGEKAIIRPYTPVSDERALGYFDLIVKHYPNGAMTSYLNKLKPGDFLDAKGPFLKYLYKANTLDEIGLIAGGSGITPMLQLARKILNNPKDNTKISLIFANRTESDIMLKEELDNYVKAYPDRFKVHYVLDNPPPSWNGGKGHITKDLLKKYLPSTASKDVMVFVCGPMPMVEKISGKKRSAQDQGEVGGFLKELGYDKENVYKF